MSQSSRIVLDAAAKVVARGTLDMGEVARLAGMSRASLYRSVRGKGALLAQLEGAGLLDHAAIERIRTTVRRRILDGVCHAIEEHGLLTVTVEQMAEAAGLSPATLYRSFADRDELIRAAFDELPVREAIAGLGDRSDAPLDSTLMRTVAEMLALVRRQPEMLRLVAFARGAEGRYMRRLRPNRGAGIRQLAKYFAGQQRLGRLRSDVTPERMTSWLLGAILSSGLPSASGSPGRRRRDSVGDGAREVVEFFLDGMTRRA